MCAPTSVITHASTFTSTFLQYSVIINQLIGASAIATALTIKFSKLPRILKSLVLNSVIRRFRA